MTVIAWDGKSIAADRQEQIGYLHFTTAKMQRTKAGEVMAGAGKASKVGVMMEWYNSGADRDKYPEFQSGDDFVLLVVVDKYGCRVYERESLPIRHDDDFVAWGMGAEVAMGAMGHGATAKEAVLIANQYCQGCGRGVDVIELN